MINDDFLFFIASVFILNTEKPLRYRRETTTTTWGDEETDARWRRVGRR
jgi:hypothetical protein